jgi:1,4-alpha-glucan branching enzyme
MTTTPPTPLPVPTTELDQLVAGEHGHPHAILGPHPSEDGITVRALKPLAYSV